MENIEEEIINELPYFKKISTLKMILFTIITLGLYPIIWVAQRYKEFNKLNIEEKPKLTIMWIISLSILWLAVWFSDSDKMIRGLTNIYSILTLILSFKMLRKIENYSVEKYGKTIGHNGFGWFFFSLYYVNFAINSFTDRLSKERQEDTEYNTKKQINSSFKILIIIFLILFCLGVVSALLTPTP